MLQLLNNLYRDQNGTIISAELVLVMTIAVLACVVGLSEVAVAVTTELNDVSNAIGSVSQSFAFTGLHSSSDCKEKSSFSGSKFRDRHDDCDRNDSCDLICGPGGENCGS